MHLKRQKIPKSWPVSRKDTKYVARPSSDIEKGIPVLVVLRDIMKLAHNKKEVKKALMEKSVLLNNKPLRDEKRPMLLFDTIKIVPMKKSYRLDISDNRKFNLSEINESESNKKISKVVNKKTLKGKKTQINLSDGNNFISDIKCTTNDSVVVNFDKKAIEKCIPLKEKSKAAIFEGKHSGKKGTVEKIDEKNKIVEINTGKDKINVLIKQIMVVE